MKALWNIPGLPGALQRTYATLSEARRLVDVDGKTLIVYSGSISGSEADLVKLMELGLIERKRVGRRTLIVLGTWEVIERRFAGSRTNVSTIFTADMSALLKRYQLAQQKVIERAFDTFGSTRRGRKAAPGVLLRQLESYERFEVSSVIDGLRIYIEGGYAERGIGERYALGIIRGCAKGAKFKEAQEKDDGVPSTMGKATVQEKDVIENKRQMRKKERASIDARVTALIVEAHGTDVSIESLPPGVVSEFVNRARMEFHNDSS